MCPLSRNSGESNSLNPKGLSRPVVGKLYLFYRSLPLFINRKKFGSKNSGMDSLHYHLIE
jgi:hypothetical protein